MWAYLAFQQQDGDEPDDVKGSNDKKQDSVSESVTEQKACNDTEDSAADGPAKSYEAGHRSHSGQWKDVCRQGHDQSRPRLLTEKCDAVQEERPSNRYVRN
jgi:hypothetical protein